MVMAETATVTSKSMVNIPARLRAKYGLKPGSRVVFVEEDSRIIMIPVPPMMELFGIDRKHTDVVKEGLRELHAERRREADES